jgi:hypothetical protein
MAAEQQFVSQQQQQQQHGVASLGTFEVVASLVESRLLAVAADEGAMSVAWEWAGRVEGEASSSSNAAE